MFARVGGRHLRNKSLRWRVTTHYPNVHCLFLCTGSRNRTYDGVSPSWLTANRDLPTVPIPVCYYKSNIFSLRSQVNVSEKQLRPIIFILFLYILMLENVATEIVLSDGNSFHVIFSTGNFDFTYFKVEGFLMST